MLREDNDVVGKRGGKKQIRKHSLCCCNTLYQNPAKHAARDSFRFSFRFFPLFFFFPFFFLLVVFLIDSKIRYEESTRGIVRTLRAQRGREVHRRPRGTLTAICAILTAAIRFDNYRDANGCERRVFSMGSQRQVGGAAAGRLGERRGVLLAGGSLSANASPPSRTHS